MYGLDLRKLVQNSASEAIHVWHMPKGKKTKSVKSIDATPAEAYKFYKEGASLYFGASPTFRDIFMKYLNF